MPGEAETEGERRMPAVSRHDNACGKHTLVAVAAGDNAGDTTGTARLVDRRAADGDGGLVLAPGGDRLPEEDPVEIAPHDGAPRLSVRVAAVDDVAALAGDPHAVDTERARVEVAVNAETPQAVEGAGIHGVAAQLVAREGRPIQKADTNARAGQDNAGNRTGRARANNDHISHVVIG